MLILPGVSNKCLFAPAPYYKLNKGFSSAFCLNREVGVVKTRKPRKRILYLLPFKTYNK